MLLLLPPHGFLQFTIFHNIQLIQLVPRFLLRRASAVHTNIPLDSIADNHRWATRRAGQIDAR